MTHAVNAHNVVIVPSKFSICYNYDEVECLELFVIVPSKFSICYNIANKSKYKYSVIVPSKFSICYNHSIEGM